MFVIVLSLNVVSDFSVVVSTDCTFYLSVLQTAFWLTLSSPTQNDLEI